MKESNFYSDDFEQLIRDKTEQYKMYPSERVWKGVHNSLHTKRRWFIGTMSFLVTGILFLAGRELIAPSGRPTALRKPATTAGSTTETTKPSTTTDIPRAPLIAFHSSNTTASAARHSAAVDETIADSQDPAYSGISITLNHPVVTPADLSDWLPRVVQLPDHVAALPMIAARTPAEAGALTDEGLRPAAARPGAEIAAGKETADIADDQDISGVAARSELLSLRSRPEQNHGSTRSDGRLAHNRNSDGTVMADGFLPDSVGASHKASAAMIAEYEDRQGVNWLHDFALNSLPLPSKKGRTFFQLTLAPTANYRVLSGTDPAIEKYGNTGTSFTAVQPGDRMNNSAAFGFEFGGSILYRVTRNLSIKGGLQFNFARYKINAFSVQQQGTSSLTTYYWYVMDSIHRNGQQPQGSSARPVDTVNQVTLNNDYFQLSAPIGFELRILGNERLQFHIGGTVQPSYLLNATSYMLTSPDQKYARDPNKYRRWNVSGALEAFLSYRTGDIRWQIGPEFRYQLLSTYTSQNAINENLKSYGIKIGITKMLP